MNPDPATIRVLSLDPGEVHCGMVVGVGPNVVEGKDMGPGELFAYMRKMFDAEAFDQVVCESFQLYEDKMAQQVGSKMLTCEHIGVIKYLCAWYGVPLKMQPAMIKKATARICKAKGIKPIKGNRHVKDAFLHFWCFTLNEGNRA